MAAREYAAGMAVAQVNHAIAGVVDPPSTDEVRALSDRILGGVFDGDLAVALERAVVSRGRVAYLLDGDNVRHGLNKDLGFTDADRVENIRRVGEVAKLMTDAGLIVITAFISPYRAERALVRSLIAEGEFIEVFVDTPLAEAERRDVKGLYARAEAGEFTGMTGLDDPYEVPTNPELRLETQGRSIEESLAEILRLIDEERTPA